MSPQMTKLLAEALELPESERGELAARLIESLDPEAEGEEGSDRDPEIEKRLSELDTGQVQSIPWSEARRMMLEDSDEPSES